MPYDLPEFIADCRAILARDPSPAGREEVRRALEHLLENTDFVARTCGEELPAGLQVLHDDPGLGFQVLAHLNGAARAGVPHNHGDSWAIYGQATHYTDMTEWRRVDDGADPARVALEEEKKYRLMPGHAGIYQDGKIHSIAYPDHARFSRVTGTNLDRITRQAFDLASGQVKQMHPQMAS
jgi:hypothetical protein